MSIEITKYPKAQKLEIIETVDNGGFVQVKLYGEYQTHNLALLQYIFIVSGAVVGKYQITQLSNSLGFTLVTLNLAYNSDTSDSYLLTNTAINADSYWNSVNFLIEFEFQRRDIEINGTYASSGSLTAIQISGNYADYNLTVSGGIYVNFINEITGADIINESTTIQSLYYNSALDLSAIVIPIPFTICTDVGFVNSNEYKENYFSTVRIETKNESHNFKVRPDSTGKMIFDASKYLKTKIEVADTFDYSEVSYRDENLGNYFTLSYSENYE